MSQTSDEKTTDDKAPSNVQKAENKDGITMKKIGSFVCHYTLGKIFAKKGNTGTSTTGDDDGDHSKPSKSEVDVLQNEGSKKNDRPNDSEIHDQGDDGQVAGVNMDEGNMDDKRKSTEKQEIKSDDGDGGNQGDSVDAPDEVRSKKNDPPNGTDETSDGKKGIESNDQVDDEREHTEKQEEDSWHRISDEANASDRKDEFDISFKKWQDSSRQAASVFGQVIQRNVMQIQTATALKVYQNIEESINSQIFHPTQPKCFVYIRSDASTDHSKAADNLKEAYGKLNITTDLVRHLDELSYSDTFDFIILHIVSDVDEDEEKRIIHKLELTNDARPRFVMIQRTSNVKELNDLTFASQNCFIVGSTNRKMTEVFTEYLKMHGEKNDISTLWKFTEEKLGYSESEGNGCAPTQQGSLSKNVFLSKNYEDSERQLVLRYA